MGIVDLFEFHSWHPHGHVSINGTIVWWLVVGGWWLWKWWWCPATGRANAIPLFSFRINRWSFFSPTLFLKMSSGCRVRESAVAPEKDLKKPTIGSDRGQFVSAVSRCSCSRSFVSLASASSHGRWIRMMAWRRKRALLAGGEEKKTRRSRSRRRKRRKE